MKIKTVKKIAIEQRCYCIFMVIILIWMIVAGHWYNLAYYVLVGRYSDKLMSFARDDRISVHYIYIYIEREVLSLLSLYTIFVLPNELKS